jgi:hypothetical protein
MNENDFPMADKPPGDTVASLPGFPLNSHGHKADLKDPEGALKRQKVLTYMNILWAVPPTIRFRSRNPEMFKDWIWL